MFRYMDGTTRYEDYVLSIKRRFVLLWTNRMNFATISAEPSFSKCVNNIIQISDDKSLSLSMYTLNFMKTGIKEIKKGIIKHAI